MVVDKPLVHVKADGLWIDNLYIREGDDMDFALISQLETPSELFLTNCTLEGTSGLTAGPSKGGLLAKNTYAEGTTPPSKMPALHGPLCTPLLALLQHESSLGHMRLSVPSAYS